MVVFRSSIATNPNEVGDLRVALGAYVKRLKKGSRKRSKFLGYYKALRDAEKRWAKEI